MPSARRLFWKPQRFPIADAHYAMGFAFLSRVYGSDNTIGAPFIFLRSSRKLGLRLSSTTAGDTRSTGRPDAGRCGKGLLSLRRFPMCTRLSGRYIRSMEIQSGAMSCGRSREHAVGTIEISRLCQLLPVVLITPGLRTQWRHKRERIPCVSADGGLQLISQRTTTRRSRAEI